MTIERYFTVASKYEDKVFNIDSLINRKGGYFIKTQTKAGFVYTVDFDSQSKGDEFDLELLELIPNLL